MKGDADERAAGAAGGVSDPLPNGWLRVRLDEVAEVRLGRQRSPDRAKGEHMRPYMRAANVTWNGISLEDVKEMDFSPREFVSYELREGDILLSEASGSASEVGKPALWRNEVDGCCFQNTLIRVRSRGPDPEYLHLHFLADARLGKFAAAGKGVGINHLGADRMSSWPTALPPLNEQRRIVAKLESLQARSRRAREALDAVPPLLEKLRQSILAAAFRGDLTKDWRAKHKDVEPASEFLKRIRVERRKKWEEAELAKLTAKGKAPRDDAWKGKYKEPEGVDAAGLPGLPEGWCWAAWREVGFCQNGRAFPSAEYSSEGTKLLRPGNLHVSGRLEWTEGNTRRMPASWATEFPDFVVGEGELLMNLTAQSLKDEFLGRVCLSAPGEKCLLNQRLARLTGLGLPTSYWLWFFKSPGFRRYVDTLNTGSLIQHMFTSQVDACAVPIMPLEEAQTLVDVITARLGVVHALDTQVQEQTAHIPSLDRALLAKAFRGELVPQDPNDEPAPDMLARLNSATR